MPSSLGANESSQARLSKYGSEDQFSPTAAQSSGALAVLRLSGVGGYLYIGQRADIKEVSRRKCQCNLVQGARLVEYLDEYFRWQAL
jgi:hypothetical protein